jgi:hypothetical protein
MEHYMTEKTGRTLYDLLAEILQKRNLILITVAVFLFVLIFIVYILFQIIKPEMGVNQAGNISIKNNFFSPKITTFLIHPRGWQDTGVDVSPNETLKVYVSGEINIGVDLTTIDKNAKAAQKIIKAKKQGKGSDMEKLIPYYELGWPWAGEEGIEDPQLKEYGKNPDHHSDDSSLITSKHEYGRLIGYITTDKKFAIKMSKAEKQRNDDERNRVKNNRARDKKENCHLDKYLKKLDVKFYTEQIIDFGDKKNKDKQYEKIDIDDDVVKGSRLYLAINDSMCPEWQIDNFGGLLVTIQQSPKFSE